MQQRLEDVKQYLKNEIRKEMKIKVCCLSWYEIAQSECLSAHKMVVRTLQGANQNVSLGSTME